MEKLEGDSVIGLFIKIPFHAQIKKAESRLAERLAEAIDEAASTFTASRGATEESFFLTFDESSRPARLCAAEAARRLSSTLASLGSRLHGWFLVLDSGSAADEILGLSKRLWYGLEDDGLYVSGRAREAFAAYFRMGEGRDCAEAGEAFPLLEALYAREVLPPGELVEEAQASSVEKLIDALGELGVGQDADASLALLGPARAPQLCLDAALAKLYPETCRRFLRLRASAVEGSPYAPLARAFSHILSPQGLGSKGSLLSGAERDLLENLRPMLDFLVRSPYRRGCSAQLSARLRLCAAAALRFYGRQMRALGLPAFVILEGIDRFPSESLQLVLGLFEESLAAEGLRLLALGTGLPAAWREEIAPRYLEIAGPTPVALAQAAIHGAEALRQSELSTSIALAAAGDPLRLRLALRLASGGERPSAAASTEELAAAALRGFPPEYAELLLALTLAEEVLTDECAEAFLGDSGYVAGIREPIYGALSALGLVTAEERPRIVSAPAARGAVGALSDGGRAMRRFFVRRLLELRSAGKILPSVALFRRIKAEAEELGESLASSAALELDCISVDAVYGPSAPAPSGEPPASSLAPMASFLDAYASGDREASLSALEALEASTREPGSGGELAAGAASLGRAAFEYADGRTNESAAIAKEALMRLHELGAGKAEAKAHRVLGYCALARGQVQEGADYFANAYDIAQAVPEPLECIHAAVAECAADFALGDMSHILLRAEAAASWATAAFRADWESAAAFIRGRACLEIGRYAEAQDSFGRVRAIARVYGQAEAARRAEIWTARAASLAGELSRAREILDRLDDDAEALWFLAELELLAGSPEKAAALAAEATSRASRPSFVTIDSFDWRSGFHSLEGRAVGCFAERDYLRDQIEAFGAFASGLASCGRELDAGDSLEEAVGAADKLANMAREERLAALHPAAHLYLFYRYLILERAMPSSMDAATALSKAFKALQLRSARLDEAAVKDGFMESNRWNKALIAAARSRKLL